MSDSPNTPAPSPADSPAPSPADSSTDSSANSAAHSPAGAPRGASARPDLVNHGETDGTLLCPNLPDSEELLEELTQRCRAHVNRRALYTTAGNLIPIPFADAAIDVGMLTATLNFINETFGLSEEQMEKLSNREQKALALLISNQGAEYAGKAVTKFIISKVVSKQAGKVAGKQAAKYVPIIGQLVAGSISYATLRYIGMKHIAQCREIIQQARGWKTDTEREAEQKQAKTQAKAEAKAAREAEKVSREAEKAARKKQKAAAKRAEREATLSHEAQENADARSQSGSDGDTGLLTDLRRRAACIGRGFKEAFSKNTPPSEP